MLRNPLAFLSGFRGQILYINILMICLIVNWKREKLKTAVLVSEFRSLHVIKLGPGFHCSNDSTLSRTKSVGLCVVMTIFFDQFNDITASCNIPWSLGENATRAQKMSISFRISSGLMRLTVTTQLFRQFRIESLPVVLLLLAPAGGRRP